MGYFDRRECRRLARQIVKEDGRFALQWPIVRLYYRPPWPYTVAAWLLIAWATASAPQEPKR
jgi:hypothetical protein